MSPRHAVMAMLLAPVVALADGATTPAPNANSPVAQAAEATAPAADATAAPEVKKDVKKETTEEKREGSKLAEAVQARTPEELARQSGFAVGVDLGHELGMGTFVSVKSWAYLGAQVSVSPRYNFTFMDKRLVASGGFSVGYEYTLPDNPTGRRIFPSDLRLGLSAPAVYKEPATGIGITPSLSVMLPLRTESWTASMITSVRLGANASRSIGNFDFGLQVAGGWGAYVNGSSAYSPADPNGRDAQGNLIALCRTGETICAGGPNNTAWTLGFNSYVNYRVTGDFILSVSYGLSKNWRYPQTWDVDQYTAKIPDANGNPAAHVGYGQMDMMASSISASYQLNEHYSINFGLSTNMQPLTDTHQVRFPFFSIGNMADNATTAFFSITGSY